MKKTASKDLIVRITFSYGIVMLFGNSYKPWYSQYEEYLIDLKRVGMYPVEILNVTVTYSPWIKWGGLKWCTESRFQKQLNREGCQENDPDNSNPRIYADIEFTDNDYVTRKAKRIFKNVYSGIY
ncbi:spore protein H [Brevibacillus laterosporus]|uniref:spore protein H n=1 Tax=Brevibacillus laterosporus TaxID=1465 RepID=UPI0024075FB4|nr:spore protein H [Brevibacillus laterosporus]MDF9412987.1 spore protein H [Brevibacillus laterosporus]MED1790612.1 spore protein H [Brevibacillus laterosporus]